MVFARRTAALRLTAMAALAASAVLISDSLHPDRAFCPLEQACEAAAASALGSIYGVPTSVLGAAAFGGLFFLTLLPVEWGRRLLQLGGFLAALAGAGFIIYQAMVLKTFCPLCLVADGAGLLAGLITLTWPTPPVRASGRRLRGEGGTSRLAWTLVGVLALAVPFVWPRPEEPSWVEIPAQAILTFEDEEEDEVPADAVPVQTHPTAIVSTAEWKIPQELAPQPRTAPRTAQAPPAQRPTTPSDAVVAHSPRQPVRPTPRPAAPAVASPNVQPSPQVTAPPEPSAPPPTRRVRRKGPVIVEYLNAYCGHCRATHHRLEKVLAEMGVKIRRHRVYAWADKDYPLWVRACSYAKDEGAEERLFAELLRARDQTPASIYAAARRAGLDVVALQCAVEDPDVPADLVRDCKRMKSAGLKGLPTLDIGRRRLMGDQSEAELREAIQAALDQAASP